MTDDDPLDLDRWRLTDEQMRVFGACQQERATGKLRTIRKRDKVFIMVPWRWHEKLAGATGQTCRLAQLLLYLHWKDRGAPIRLTNRLLEADGISRQSKWRALRELERRGLIQVECRARKSPMVWVIM
jgi:hypothetical protein